MYTMLVIIVVGLVFAVASISAVYAYGRFAERSRGEPSFSVIMMLIATMTVSLVTNSGRSAWFVGVLVLLVYLIFAMTLYLLPPRVL
jgi:Ca2+/H+ antiporter